MVKNNVEFVQIPYMMNNMTSRRGVGRTKE
jgi:hypothetical protein